MKDRQIERKGTHREKVFKIADGRLGSDRERERNRVRERERKEI